MTTAAALEAHDTMNNIPRHATWETGTKFHVELFVISSNPWRHGELTVMVDQEEHAVETAINKWSDVAWPGAVLRVKQVGAIYPCFYMVTRSGYVRIDPHAAVENGGGEQ